MTFKAKFYDGKTSKTNDAEVSISGFQWTIRYMENERLVEIRWKTDQIKTSDVYTSGFVAFTYGKSFPFQRLESTDERFILHLNKQNDNNLNRSLDTTLHKSKISSLIGLIAGLLGLVIVTYLYIIPAVAENFAAHLNTKRVKDFGDYVFRVLSPDLDIDDEKTKKLRSFVKELQFDTEFEIEAYVANSKQLNAFALSGGKIVIFSSLLEKIETKEQLVALLGHEAAHIEKRHVLKNISRNLSGAIFISILFGDVNSVTAILADNAHMFSQLSFSRGLEKEADLYGLEIMKKNKVNLRGMHELFELLKKESDFDIPAYLSNHPMLKDRIEYTKALADESEKYSENEKLEEKWNDLKSMIMDHEDDLLIPEKNE